MMIQLELEPETEKHLAAGAQSRGIAPEQYAATLLKETIAPMPMPNGILSVPDVETMLKEMSEESENFPELPDSALTRESFYQDRF